MGDSCGAGGRNVSSKAKLFEDLVKNRKEEKEKSYYHHVSATIQQPWPDQSVVNRAQTVNFAQFSNFAPLATSEEEDSTSPYLQESSEEQKMDVNQNLNVSVRERGVSEGRPPAGGPERKLSGNLNLKIGGKTKENGEEEKDESSRLTVWEKMKLFEKKIQEHGQKLYRKGVSRFQTQPVTPEEVRAAVVSIKNSQTETKRVEFPGEGGKKSTSSALERVKARKVVHLHTEESQSQPIPEGKKKEESASGNTTAEESLPESTLAKDGAGDREGAEALEKRRRARQEKRSGEQKLKEQQEPETPSVSDSFTRSRGGSQEQKRYFGLFGRSKTTEAGNLASREEVGEFGTDSTDMIETERRLSIGERLAALKSTEEDWRRRVAEEKKCKPESEVLLRSRSGASDDERPKKITERMSLLLNSQERWQQRVTEKDTGALTVCGKLEKAGIKIIQPPSTPSAPTKQPSPPARAESPNEEKPPQKPVRLSKLAKTRSDTEASQDSSVRLSMLPQLDEGLDDFYKPSRSAESSPDSLKIDSEALDAIAAAEKTPKLALTKGVKPPRRRAVSAPRNPIKHLAESDLVQKGYQETVTKTPLVQLRRGLGAGQETDKSGHTETPKRPYSAVLDPLLRPGNRGTQLASEALRALAAKEDFGAVKLRKADPNRTPGQATENRPYKDLMLIQVKGKKHVQLRLVEPTWKSLNSGDCFILLTGDNVFLYEGRFANVLEKAKAKEVASYIVETRDLGCLGSSRVIDMNEEKVLAIEEKDGRLSPSQDRFWSLLGGGSVKDVRVPTDLEEDKLFEESLAVACLAYRMISPNDDSVYKLQLSEEHSGEFLEHNMLKEDEVWVLDFGCELYVWNGRSVSGEQRKAGLKLAREVVWEKEFDVGAAGGDPFVPFEANSVPTDESSAVKSRPDWCLFGQVKEKMETALFRGKFIDWPEMRTPSTSVGLEMMLNGVCRSPSPSKMAKQKILEFKDPSAVQVTPEDLGKQLVTRSRREPDLVLEDRSVGRGHNLISNDDPKLSKYQVVTDAVKMFYVTGGAELPVEMPEKSFGQFHIEDCYIVRWDYRVVTADARSLSGAESKHSVTQTGRNRVAHFYWHGTDSSRSDQGACALALRDLDPGRNPQVRVTQGLEPPAFLNLFQGKMAIHRGKRGRRRPLNKGWRLYAFLGGPFDSESCLVEMDPDPNISLRTQGVFLLTNVERNTVYLWTGRKSRSETRRFGQKLVWGFRENVPGEFGFGKLPSVRECQEGEEPHEWLKSFGVDHSKLKYPKPTPDYDLNQDNLRLFRFTSTSSKQFSAVEAVSSWFSKSMPVTFPFEQDDLYGASQPAFFLVDQGKRTWLWEGWMDQEETGQDESVSQKLRLARLFAVKTAAAYCEAKGLCQKEKEKGYVVYAGLEPEEFRGLFPVWLDQEDAQNANLKAMRAPGAKVDIRELLKELTVSVYPASRLRERPLPEGVDGSKLESYLSDEEFLEIFSMSRQCFYELPAWKQLRLRKESHLF